MDQEELFRKLPAVFSTLDQLLVGQEETNQLLQAIAAGVPRQSFASGSLRIPGEILTVEQELSKVSSVYMKMRMGGQSLDSLVDHSVSGVDQILEEYLPICLGHLRAIERCQRLCMTSALASVQEKFNKFIKQIASVLCTIKEAMANDRMQPVYDKAREEAIVTMRYLAKNVWSERALWGKSMLLFDADGIHTPMGALESVLIVRGTLRFLESLISEAPQKLSPRSD